MELLLLNISYGYTEPLDCRPIHKERVRRGGAWGEVVYGNRGGRCERGREEGDDELTVGLVIVQ